MSVVISMVQVACHLLPPCSVAVVGRQLVEEEEEEEEVGPVSVGLSRVSSKVEPRMH